VLEFPTMNRSFCAWLSVTARRTGNFWSTAPVSLLPAAGPAGAVRTLMSRRTTRLAVSVSEACDLPPEDAAEIYGRHD
jgi:hypothetical protein